MQAIILAAGMGKRLKDLTNDNTKCMIKVNGVTLIERMLRQLDKLILKQIIIVIGYQSQKLVDYISELSIKTKIIYVNNDIYDRTNNIYSLYLAKDYLIRDDTILLESDLIFEDKALLLLVDNPYPSLALIAKYESWMDGTVVTIDDDNNIKNFLSKKQFKFEDAKKYYKTVNIYKFSKEFSSSHYVPFLEAYSKALGNNEYYEQVLKVITLLEKPEIKASVLNKIHWYEIDDVQDLDIAESIFARSPEEQLEKMQKRYGGYWRYENIIDYCYLVNPFFPPQKMLDEIKASFDCLVRDYPSGLFVNNLLAAKYFGLKQEYVVVGNGAAELIKAIMKTVNGNIGIIIPTFEEYPNRYIKEKTIRFRPQNKFLQYDATDIMAFFEKKDITTLFLINPDNPSGNYIFRDDVIRLAEWTKNERIKLVLDESFIDFVDKENNPSLMNNDLLIKYPHMTIIKSISKSFGVPGVRLGILASSDSELVNHVINDLSIWNINSFGEFFLQIFEKYKSDYIEGMNKFSKIRDNLYTQLNEIKHLRVIPSQSNYFLCELLDGYKATTIAVKLLSEHDLFIKDLTSKNGFDGQYIRLAIKLPEENILLVNALKKILN
jgi:histidinol-phosphate/aromatic aminotransferase/cobyric acid decarboxylase-like protein/GTP:adenosylcobinamide-phosphate guanylyltransferase